MFLNNHFSSYFKRHKGRAPVSPCVRRQAGAVQVGPVFLWEEGLQGGKATPNLSHRGYLPGTVTCVGAKDDGQAGEDLGTDGAGLSPQGLAHPLGRS